MENQKNDKSIQTGCDHGMDATGQPIDAGLLRRNKNYPTGGLPGKSETFHQYRCAFGDHPGYLSPLQKSGMAKTH
jgi:hypothetical protein